MRIRRRNNNSINTLYCVLAVIPSLILFFSTLSLMPSNDNQYSTSSSTFVDATQPHHATSASTIAKHASPEKSLSSSSATDDDCTPHQRKKFELVQVQIIHRHGDRTPITPMRDEKYWGSTLPSKMLLNKIAEGTKIKRESDDSNTLGGGGGATHAASGRGPFGKLTQLGLFQMVEVGSRLRDELYYLSSDTEDNDGDEHHHFDEDGNVFLHKGRLFHKHQPLSPHIISVKSTDFPRTIQSVQALLVGMFPDGLVGHNNNHRSQEETIEIDTRFTDILIPDPQPRATQEQIQLEKALSQRDHVVAKESKLQHLAKKISLELQPYVGEDANSVSFGIGEEGEGEDLKAEERPLSFSQLSEILVCLKVRGLLPESITMDEFETLTSHSAWKWFENLRDPKLAFLAMKSFMNFIMKNLEDGQKAVGVSSSADNPNSNPEHTKLHIFSAHDSSLIGLMCVFRLQQPSEWPEYGSYLKIELFKAQPFVLSSKSNDDDNCSSSEDKYFVRFSLNGNVLKSEWGLGENDYLEAKDMIPLDHLQATIKSEHGY